MMLEAERDELFAFFESPSGNLDIQAGRGVRALFEEERVEVNLDATTPSCCIVEHNSLGESERDELQDLFYRKVVRAAVKQPVSDPHRGVVHPFTCPRERFQ